MSITTVSKTFDISLVNTSDKTSQVIIAAMGTRKLANYQYHLACIGAAYQVLLSGNRNQIKELLDSLGKKSQRYQKINECLRILTGEMLVVTEDKGELTFDYKFNAEAKAKMLGDEGTPVEDTEFYKLAQKPWYDYELASEDYGFDADKINKSIASSVKKGAIGGISLEAMIASVTAAHAEGLKERAEKEQAERAKAEKVLANVDGLALVKTIANAINIPQEDAYASEIAQCELIVNDFESGELDKATAISRLGELESTVNAMIQRAEAAAETAAAESATAEAA